MDYVFQLLKMLIANYFSCNICRTCLALPPTPLRSFLPPHLTKSSSILFYEHSIPGEATSLIYWLQAAASTSMWLMVAELRSGLEGRSGWKL